MIPNKLALHPSTYLSIYLSIHPSIYIYLSIYLSQDGEWVLVANTRLSPEAGDYALTGTVTAEMAGSVRLRFDNSYSWARSKTVLYKLE